MPDKLSGLTGTCRDIFWCEINDLTRSLFCGALGQVATSRILNLRAIGSRWYYWLVYDLFTALVEQQYFEIEKRLSHSQERLVAETRECQSLRQELEKLSKSKRRLWGRHP